MNHKGCTIEPDIPGLYTLTITENGKPVKIIRNLSLRRASQIAEKELTDAERTSPAAESR